MSEAAQIAELGPQHYGAEHGDASQAHQPRRAAQRNHALTATALELQPRVAALAKKNLAEWSLSERATVAVGDVRERKPDAAFELATLHNNIYYFPVAERVALLRHVRAFLKLGGKLLLTTGGRGGISAMSVLSLWGALTEGAGLLPDVPELGRQLREAGFASVTTRRAFPGEAFFAFVAQR